jgi:hypothetical protein
MERLRIAVLGALVSAVAIGLVYVVAEVAGMQVDWQGMGTARLALVASLAAVAVALSALRRKVG